MVLHYSSRTTCRILNRPLKASNPTLFCTSTCLCVKSSVIER